MVLARGIRAPPGIALVLILFQTEIPVSKLETLIRCWRLIWVYTVCPVSHLLDARHLWAKVKITLDNLSLPRENLSFNKVRLKLASTATEAS